MVNMRQRHLTILEFQEGGSDDEIISYIQNNMDFMKNHCLAFHKNISQHVGDFLKLSGIDYFCVSQCLKDRLVDAKILTDIYGSDHCPVLLEMKEEA